MHLSTVARWGYYWRPTKRARMVSHPACTIPMCVDNEAHNDGDGESAPQERLRRTPSPIHLPRKKEKQCGAIVAQAWDTDIAPAAVEWRDTRYRNRHGRSGPAHRPSRRQISDEAGNTGSLTPYWTASRKPPRGSRFYPRGRAVPERYPGRVAHLTHNGALASNSSPGPHRTFNDSFSLVGTNGSRMGAPESEPT